MTNENEKPDLASLRIDRGPSDRPRSRKWLWLIPIAAAILVVAGYSTLKDRIRPAVKVKAGTVTFVTGSEAAAELVATGYVVAQRKAEVASEASGRLEFIGYEEGDVVEKDEVIARIDNAIVAAELHTARAELRKAEAEAHRSIKSLRRANSLFSSRSISQDELEVFETTNKLAIASVDGAGSIVRRAEVALENTFIRAPFTGTVLSKNAEIGEMVAPFASAASSKGSVVTLADMSSLEVEADVSESNIHKVYLGQPCEIILDAYPEHKYRGKVKKIVPTADRTRATVLTKIAFINKDKRVLPEMSARINFMGRTGPNSEQLSVLVVPKEGLTSRNGVRVAFVVEGERIVMATVEEGREFGNKIEVLSGLEAGDRVVLSPPGKMAAGQKVVISD